MFGEVESRAEDKWRLPTLFPGVVFDCNSLDDVKPEKFRSYCGFFVHTAFMRVQQKSSSNKGLLDTRRLPSLPKLAPTHKVQNTVSNRKVEFGATQKGARKPQVLIADDCFARISQVIAVLSSMPIESVKSYQTLI